MMNNLVYYYRQQQDFNAELKATALRLLRKVNRSGESYTCM